MRANWLERLSRMVYSGGVVTGPPPIAQFAADVQPFWTVLDSFLGRQKSTARPSVRPKFVAS